MDTHMSHIGDMGDRYHSENLNMNSFYEKMYDFRDKWVKKLKH